MPARAQEASGTAAPPPDSAVIRHVEVVRENVFPADSLDSWYKRAANALHIVTRPVVVQRELLVGTGMPYDTARASETERNMRKMEAFSDVRVDTVRADSGLVMQVDTRDAWSTAPYLSFRVQGDQYMWGLGITERNLLGTHTYATIRYKSDPDRTTTSFGGFSPRLIGGRAGVRFNQEQLSDGQRTSFSIEAPFLAMASAHSGELSTQYFDGEVLRFFEGDTIARDTLRRIYTQVRGEAGRVLRSSNVSYLRLFVAAQYRRDDFAQLEDAAGPARSRTGAVTLSVEASRSRWTTLENYRIIGVREDVDLSTTVRIGASYAPRGLGYERTGIGPLLTASTGRELPGGFVYGRVKATSLYTSEGLDSASVTAYVTSAVHTGPDQKLILHADGGWLKNPFPGNEFDLGLTFGPRGYPLHSFTGDRGFYTSAEWRWTVREGIGGLVSVGLAGFADYGGAWYAGSPRRTGSDLGAGLRIASPRATPSKGAGRIDVAYRRGNDALSGGWVMSIGTGFTFERMK